MVLFTVTENGRNRGLPVEKDFRGRRELLLGGGKIPLNSQSPLPGKDPDIKEGSN